MKCPICSGTGTIEVESWKDKSQYEKMECVACHGEKRLPFMKWVPFMLWTINRPFDVLRDNE